VMPTDYKAVLEKNKVSQLTNASISRWVRHWKLINWSLNI
jgi:hypothetical protein